MTAQTQVFRSPKARWRRMGPQQSDVSHSPDLSPGMDPPEGARISQANGGGQAVPRGCAFRNWDARFCSNPDVTDATTRSLCPHSLVQSYPVRTGVYLVSSGGCPLLGSVSKAVAECQVGGEAFCSFSSYGSRIFCQAK